MGHPETQAGSRVGPFVAGSSSSDLIGLATQPELGLRLLEKADRTSDFYKARCDALEAAAREFFFEFDGCSSMIFQKTRDTTSLPDFVEYVYGWLADDRLCGFILSGVTSDAGTHEQINEQETAFWNHTAEVAEALAAKYPDDPTGFVNFFNFVTFPESLAGAANGGHLPAALTRYERLVTSTIDNEPTAQDRDAPLRPRHVRPLGAQAGWRNRHLRIPHQPVVAQIVRQRRLLGRL